MYEIEITATDSAGNVESKSTFVAAWVPENSLVSDSQSRKSTKGIDDSHKSTSKSARRNLDGSHATNNGDGRLKETRTRPFSGRRDGNDQKPGRKDTKYVL